MLISDTIITKKYAQNWRPSVKQNQIKSVNHKIGTYHQTKVALTAFDTKRWICDDNIHTLAHGHYATSLVEDISLDL